MAHKCVGGHAASLFGENAGKTRMKLLACLAAVVAVTAPVAHAGLTKTTNSKGGTDYTVDKDGYINTVGDGKSTPNNSNVTLVEGGKIEVTNKPAVSVKDNVSVTIAGNIVGHIDSGNGSYGTGANLVESNSYSTITITSTGSITKDGRSGNAEAINVHGIGNKIYNYGTITVTHSDAIWFQDNVATTDSKLKNVVDNYGDIIRTDAGSVIGTSHNNGIKFHNRTGAEVQGNLSFSGGNDELYFEAGSKVTGSIDGGGGKNTLLLEGDRDKGFGVLAGGVKNFQTLDKIDTGTWELAGNVDGFTTTKVEDGILRLRKNSTLSTGTMTVDAGATLAGGGSQSMGSMGIIYADSLIINGVFSPDALENSNGSDFSVATLGIVGNTLTLGSTAHIDYDAVQGAATKTDTGENDLIMLGNQMVTLTKGAAINVRTEYDPNTHKNKQLGPGWYLVVDSDGANFQNANLNDTLTLSINGDAKLSTSPRNDIHFEYGTDTRTNDEIWLQYTHNSLTMDWTGGNANWLYGADIMSSLQQNSGVREKQFEDGDKVHLSGSADITLGDGTKEMHPVVSGLVVGRNSTGTDSAGDVKITGTGNIVADASSATGKYVNQTSTPVTPTGKLEKYGTGTLTLANKTKDDSGNRFNQGIDLYEGGLHIGAANVLGTKKDAKATDASLTVTFKNKNAGATTTDVSSKRVVLDDYDAPDRKVVLDNHFVVEDNIGSTHSALRPAIVNASTNNMYITTKVSNAKAAIEVGENSFLQLHAQSTGLLGAGGNIYLTGNAGLASKDILLKDNSALIVDGNRSTYVQSGMFTDTGAKATVLKAGNGTLQIEANSTVNGLTEVTGGTLRVAGGVTYTNNATGTPGGDTYGFVVKKAVNSSVPSSVAGGGTVKAENILIAGNISPDSVGAKTPVSTDDVRFGHLTLDASGSTKGQVTLADGFTMDFDITKPTKLNGSGLPTVTQDLLTLKSNGTNAPKILGKGTIDIGMGDNSFADVDKGYLIIKSDLAPKDGSGNLVATKINGIGNTTGILKATINGRNADSFGTTTPRGGIEFEMRDDTGIVDGTAANNKNVWLVHSLNSLTMDWSVSGTTDWSFTTENMESLQANAGNREKIFMNGDEVYLVNTSGSAATINMGDEETPTRVGVSGLTAGKTAGGVEAGNGNITISGAGGIRAVSKSAFGTYANSSGGTPAMTQSGALDKYGAGTTLTLANTGKNYFEEGVNLYGGTLELAAVGVISAQENKTAGHEFASTTINLKDTAPTSVGAKREIVVADYAVEEGKIRELQNSIVVDAGLTNTSLKAEGDVTISGAIDVDDNRADAAVIGIGAGSIFALDANAGDITLKNANATAITTDLKKADIALNGGAEVRLNGSQNIYSYNGISDNNVGTNRVTKFGTGVVQIHGGANNFNGITSINSGTFRVMKDVTYGNNQQTFELGGGTTTLAGAGKIKGDNIILSGTISPDQLDASDSTNTNQYGVLTLTASGTTKKVALGNGFTYEYDASNPNWQTGEAAVTAANIINDGNLKNDLLSITGFTTVTLSDTTLGVAGATDGTIDITTDAAHGHLATGNYLLIASDKEITKASDGNSFHDNDIKITHYGVLGLTINGDAARHESIRAEYEFAFNDDANITDNFSASITPHSEIWLVVAHNSLQMDLDTSSGTITWGDGSKDWTSLQGNDPVTAGYDKEKRFADGDFVYITPATGSVTVDLARDVTVTGLQTGKSSGGATGNGDVVFTGDFGIDADKNAYEGDFAKLSNANTNFDEFDTTGTFQKFGNGTTTFENTGGNNFSEGIEINAGTVAFNRADQLGHDQTTRPNGNKITFKKPTATNAATPTLWAYESETISNAIAVDPGAVGDLKVAQRPGDAPLPDGEKVVLTHNGNLSGDATTAIQKTGDGILKLEQVNNTAYNGRVDVLEGELTVNGKYGNATGFQVVNGATLSGVGTLGARTNGGYIRSGGTLAPKGMELYHANSDHTADVQGLTIVGDLTFENDSNFNVTLSQDKTTLTADDKYTPKSDWVKVTNGGTVTIDGDSKLNVGFDFFGGMLSIYDFNEEKSSFFTIIDANNGAVGDETAQFDLTLLKKLPRGVEIVQGWRDKEFQLWFQGNGQGYGTIGDTPNEHEIGGNIDDLTHIPGAGGLGDLIDHLTDMDDDDVPGALDQLDGDIAANTVGSGMKRPWRTAFNRFDRDARQAADPCDPCATGSSHLAGNPCGSQLWAEFTASHVRARNDGNAFSHNVNRLGVAVGYDQRLGSDTTLGVMFRYTNPHLKQDTGKSRWDDYEVGLYGRTWIGDLFELRAYAGYSHQDYKIDRHVSLPATDLFAATYDSFSSRTSGNSLAASLELTRPFQVNRNFWLSPVAAFDYEQVWMKGYREQGAALTALEMDKSNYKQFMARVGVDAQFQVSDRVNLNAKAQYVRQLNGKGYGVTGVRFANATVPDQRWAQIRGTDVGKNSVNLGIGMDVKLNRAKTSSLYVNYDVDIYRKQTTHAGEVGVMFSF